MAKAGHTIIRTAVLPGLWPRIKSLVGSGFSVIASLIAVIYYNVGLLPAGHAYLQPNNAGRFGIINVMAEAGRKLEFSRQNTDKIIVYFTIMAGLVLLAVQLALFVFSLFSTPVMAGTWSDYFLNTPAGHNSSQDIAFIVLEDVFGIRAFSGTGAAVGFYDSCISNFLVDCTDINGETSSTTTVYPRPIHLALHQLLHFYSMGIAFVASVILIYYVIAIVAETITTGTPFGQRTNKAWFIPRLILFFALIAPITTLGNNSGINAAQLITFSVAKFGSNMATNAWLNFVDTAATESVAVTQVMGGGKSWVASPNTPEIGALTQFMHVVRMCMFAEKVINGIDVFPYVVRSHSDDTTSMTLHDGTTTPYNSAGGTTDDYIDYFSTNFEDALVFSRYNNVVLRFGHRNPPGGSATDPNDLPGAYDDWGYVEPTCGEMKFEVTSTDDIVINGIQALYYNIIYDYLTNDPIADMTTHCMIMAVVPYAHNPECVGLGYGVGGTFGFTTDTRWIDAEAARANIEYYNGIIKENLAGESTDWGTYTYTPGTGFIDQYSTNFETNNYFMPGTIRERGWAGAALWYNEIASINGLMTSAIQNIPRPFKYPRVMEEIAAEHKTHDERTSYAERFNPRLQNGALANVSRAGDQYMAAVLYSAFNFWKDSEVHETVFTDRQNNAIMDTINMIIGTNGLYDILENDGVHPLAMLSAMGKSMVDAALRNLFGGIVGQGIGQVLDNFVGQMAQTGGSFAMKFGMVGLSVGFILYYVLPFMPFIYFFFAFSGWIKSIFEAIVAMPLWALAHLKLDGEGLPGPWASNGYFLLMEIFLRPTLIVVGFIASIALFASLVDVLHEVFSMLTLVATGYDIEAELFTPITVAGGMDSIQFWRGPLDEFFYTVIYVMIVYMIGLSCFKLIDAIPNQIMRWMGVTVATFQENAGDPASELSGRMFRGSQIANAQIMQLVERGGRSAGGHDRVTESMIVTR